MENRTDVPILLIVEDRAKILALRDALREQALDVVVAATQAEGLERLRNGTFALIIIDLDLPGNDGFETVRLLREFPAAQATPVLFVSSIKPEEPDLKRGYLLGIVDFLHAPLDARSLNSRVKVLSRVYGEASSLREEREIARTQLRQSEERNRRLVEEIQDYAIIMLDPGGVIASWNKGFERILGYRADEIVGRHFSIIYTPEDLAIGKPAAELKSALAEGRNKEVGLRVRKDGSRFWGEEILSPMRDDHGVLTGFIKVIRDITAQKQTDAARTSEVRYLEGMAELSRVLELNLEMEQVLQMAVERVLHLFQGDRAFLIHPLDPAQSRIRIPYLAEKERDLPDRRGEFPLEAFHQAMIADLLASADPIVFDSGPPIPWFKDTCLQDAGGSLVAIAIRPKNGRPWALGIHQSAAGRIWSGEELRLFKDIAQRLTGVLDNLILHRNLQASEKRFRWLVENTTEIVWRIDMKQPVSASLPEEEQVELFYRDGFLAECNDAMARRYGYKGASEILGIPMDRLLPRDQPGNLEYLVHFIRSKYRSLDSETVEQDNAGRRRYVLNNLVGILDGGFLTGAWGTSRDITDRRLAEEEVRRSRDQLDVILQGIADAIMVYSPSGSLVYFNEAASRMLGIPSPAVGLGNANGAQLEEIVKRMEVTDESGKPMPPERTPIQSALRGMETPPTLLRYRLSGRGQERWLITRAKPILDAAGKVRMVISIAQDTTDLRKAEEQFRQSQKMEAVGRLAGGVAHDFNNLLTAINGYSELILGMTEKEDQRRPYLEEIRKAGERAASLTNQLLVYSRRQIVAPKTISVNTVVSQMETMLRRLIGEDIDLAVRLRSDLVSIKADPGQIEQVILNLAVNSRDAMPKGGRLILETEQLETGRGGIPGVTEEVPPGRYVRLSVRDSGVGMEDHVKSHLFEPFFTTKKMGRGTGLGLSTVYGIVRQSGGYIVVESEKGMGTAISVYFPASACPAPPEKVPWKAQTAVSELTGSETVLVAEDDFAVRSLVKDILASYGYRVLEAGNGVEAMEAAGRFPGKIDLLLTDLVMAQMGGRELADRMKSLRPQLKTIYMSGYTDDAIVLHGVFTKTDPFLQKPFAPESLARMVRQVLDSVPA
ncbi:MAG TPA: PAS domain S-box protein [Fibrobacteria bacterium]|nr:PAS domain S-box protein [Fibrobacteria bacterium]